MYLDKLLQQSNLSVSHCLSLQTSCESFQQAIVINPVSFHLHSEDFVIDPIILECF